MYAKFEKKRRYVQIFLYVVQHINFFNILLFLILRPPLPVGDYRWSTCVLFRKATVLCISLYITISSLTNGTSLR